MTLASVPDDRTPWREAGADRRWSPTVARESERLLELALEAGATRFQRAMLLISEASADDGSTVAGCGKGPAHARIAATAALLARSERLLAAPSVTRDLADELEVFVVGHVLALGAFIVRSTSLRSAPVPSRLVRWLPLLLADVLLAVEEMAVPSRPMELDVTARRGTRAIVEISFTVRTGGAAPLALAGGCRVAALRRASEMASLLGGGVVVRKARATLVATVEVGRIGSKSHAGRSWEDAL